MNRFLSILCASAGLCLAAPCAVTGEAHESLYVVDRCEEFAETGGACVEYAPQLKPGETRGLLAVAKGPPGSTLFLIALGRDGLHRGRGPRAPERHRRGLKTLDEEWREDSRTLEFGPDEPGILVFPVTQPEAQ